VANDRDETIVGKKPRLSGEERRESILRAVRQVFAENGFRGTTTRALAEAAGVSEALLFQHFPNKEALFAAMQARFARELDSDDYRESMGGEPSTAALVQLVYRFYASLILTRHRGSENDAAILARLMFRSLMEDGEFARLFIKRVPSRLIAKIAQCIPAAIAAGDLDLAKSTDPHSLSCWFTHHLGVFLMLHHLPDPPVIDYGVSSAKLVEQAVRFALRGIGLKEEAIERYYRPEDFVKGPG
jgi:AcrR family transcriptional regulator